VPPKNNEGAGPAIKVVKKRILAGGSVEIKLLALQVEGERVQALRVRTRLRGSSFKVRALAHGQKYRGTFSWTPGFNYQGRVEVILKPFLVRA